VELLGHEGVLKFQHSDQGLMVSIPATPPCQHAWALRITGQKLRDFEPQESIYAVEPDAEGALLLNADEAEIHGSSPRVEQKPNVDKSNIGHWGLASDWVSWRLKIPKAAAYRVSARISSLGRATRFTVELDDQRVTAESIPTKGWEEFVPVDIGQLTADGPGVHTLSVKPLGVETWKPIGLLEVKLVPVSP
jgi:hypothetical protein